jgi:glycosyltransferase involved in cell wall biosynthesis
MVIEQKNKILVSIIVPFYNVEDFIENTLISIEGQIFRDFEVILINDGSTDNSHKVVEKYLSKCSFRSLLLSQENSGVSAARNRGLLNAAGEYIVFVDADDILSPRYVGQMYENISKNKTQMTICSFDTFVDDKSLPTKIQHEGKAELIDSLDLKYKFLLGTVKISVCSIMVKRELLSKYNIRFAEGYKYSEDIHFVWRVLAHTDKVVIDLLPLYYYRWRSGSAMANFAESRLDGLYLMKDLEKYFQTYCEGFAQEFKKYGVARWVWSTMWQAACALPYSEFKAICLKMNAGDMMKKLKKFPDVRVSKSASLYNLNYYAYYRLARITACLTGINRF